MELKQAMENRLDDLTKEYGILIAVGMLEEEVKKLLGVILVEKVGLYIGKDIQDNKWL